MNRHSSLRERILLRKTDIHSSMPPPAHYLHENAQPKINQPLTGSSPARYPSHNDEHSLLADDYASQILGTPLPARERSWLNAPHPWIAKTALILLAFGMLWAVSFTVYHLRRNSGSEEAELTFDPSRISSPLPTVSSVAPEAPVEPPFSENEEEHSLQRVPRRRVMVVTEGEREKLLERLKNTDVHHTDTETLDTYVHVPLARDKTP